MTHSKIIEITNKIIERSKKERTAYLDFIQSQSKTKPNRGHLSCGNLAHGFAACSQKDKVIIQGMQAPNVAIISAYNDMLSAHQPYQPYPDKIKEVVSRVGATAQFAGGVPAMCDGVTQGLEGMELSLFSRDSIAQSTAIALTHNMFDAAICLGICDKIVPGLLIASLRFGHLPIIFIPAGPMESGIANEEKARVRTLFAEGKVGREELLDVESRSYHSAGTCTFYGTANSNQMLMEIMGLQIPGSSFVHPNTPLREKLTEFAAEKLTQLTQLGQNYLPMAEVIDERSIVNAIVGLMATGGSTNHTIHLIAIAKAAGITINWDDFSEISKITPLIARVYPNGKADVNQFHAAGGMANVMAELLSVGLLHGDAKSMFTGTMSESVIEPMLENDALIFKPVKGDSLDQTILSGVEEPFQKEGGLILLKGNLGRCVIKVSAVEECHRVVKAPAKVYTRQEDFVLACQNNEVTSDAIIVVKNQGPKSNGMPELHKLTPYLVSLQNQGIKIGLVTDGRMSGASGKVPAAIHLIPEAKDGGNISKIQNGDIVELDAINGILQWHVSEEEIENRQVSSLNETATNGFGRELFENFRTNVSDSESGASIFTYDYQK